ncbi:hypothetical protein [Nostoc sp. 'Peltigera malacea cyanobiont' DB3992]|uniref:hypothetical protein n=1 Tax=Nostoc sp. 'Peltigera malacea cyanobiont' DB3992 TaxID=1206980 RepID=UPI00211F2D85|nr:hypothetical protein [Nostoc sp. 'Peltigera malacea cyanobiont' DB3992]
MVWVSGSDEFTVNVGGVLTEVMVMPVGVPLASPPLGKTGKLFEGIIEVPPVLIVPVVPLTLASPTIKFTLFGPPSWRMLTVPPAKG